MRQHIFYFSVFISIIGLMSISTVDAAEITEYFDSDPGWISFNLPVNNNDFGFRNSNFAGGNTGEAGGFFSRTDQGAWYGNDTIGNFTGNEVLSASGLMNIYNVEPGYNNDVHIGHFDSVGPTYINGIGFLILEYPTNNQGINPSSFRIFYKIGDYDGLLFIITGIRESRTWSYLYDPNDGSYGSLTVSISGSGGNTATVFLSESQRNSIGTLNTFGLVNRGLGSSEPEQCELYIDNVSILINTGETCYIALNLRLENQILSTTDTFEACETITAGPAVTVTSTGNVTFQAGERVILKSGFSVEDGGRLSVIIDPSTGRLP